MHVNASSSRNQKILQIWTFVVQRHMRGNTFFSRINTSSNPCVSDFQLEEIVHVLRKRIEPEAQVAPAPAPPSAPLPDPTPMEEDAVSLASPTPVVPPPPLPEAQNEGEQAEQQQQQEESQEERQEEQQQPPPPPAGSEELLTPTEPQDSTTGEQSMGAEVISILLEKYRGLMPHITCFVDF